MLSNHVSEILVTADGTILIGTSMGMQIYNPEYNRFDKVSLWFNGSDSLPVHVVSIKPTPKGNLIVGTLGCGVFKVDKSSWQGKQVLEPKDQNSFVTNMAVTNDGNVWMSLAREGAKRGVWDTAGNLILMPISGAEEWKIEDVVTDNKGDAYFCAQDGIYQVKRKDLSIHQLIKYDKDKILSLLLYKDNILLIGTEGGGILAYDLITGTPTDPGFISSRFKVSDSNVRAMLIDNAGNFWAGLYQRGVLACQSQSSQFEYIGSERSLTEGTLSRPVMALYPDADGTLWVAPEKDGLYAIRSANDVRHYPQNVGALPSLITCIFKASDGTIWIGSIDSGLARLDPQSGNCTYIPDFMGMSIFDIVEDKNHRLWIGSMGEGLYRTDLNGIIEYTAPHTDSRHFTPGSDLIITDVMLPDDSGVTLIKLVRQNIHTNDLPIIVLSAKNAEEDIMECIDNGADSYMTKPFKIKVLKSYISSLLELRHRLKVKYNGNQIDENVSADTSDIKTPDDLMMERLTRALNANLSNPDYSIADLASDVCMSRVHLNRKLKQLTNQSPSTYLRNMRLAKAAEILRNNPGISVGDVAAKLGISSFSHFSHAFKQLYGCSPSEYAERSTAVK